VRILLDTNVWRHVVDADAVQQLRALVRDRGAEIVVAPGVVYEILRTPHPATRNAQIKAVTLGAWTKLRTEVYDECHDVCAMLAMRRPDWLLKAPDLAYYYTLRADWSPGVVSGSVPSQPTRADSGVRPSHPDGLGRIDVWRLISSGTWWSNLIEEPRQPYLDWIGPFLDLGAISQSFESWNRLWLHEVSVDELGPGTPVDNQIAQYAYEADLFLSGDKAIVDIINRARESAPKPLAVAQLMAPGADPVRQVDDAITPPRQRCG
jgi:hypothetical protein